MRRIFVIVAVMLSCIMILCSCGGGDSLNGKWKQVEGEGTLFFSDNSVTVNGVEYLADSAEYEYEHGAEGTLIINDEKAKKEITYKLDGDTLTITYGDVSDKYVRVDVGNQKGKDKDEKPEEKEPEKSKTDEPTDDEIKASIIGIWVTEYKGSKLVYQFNEDGTGMASIIPMTYTVENGVITVTASAFGKTETGSASYSVSDDTLALQKDGDTLVMKKTTKEALENE